VRRASRRRRKTDAHTRSCASTLTSSTKLSSSGLPRLTANPAEETLSDEMSAPKEVAQVIVMNGPLAGSVVEVGEKLTLGRRPENTLRLRDDRVSRYHAVIERRGGQYVIEDLGSRTGTTVDGLQIDAAAALHHGSQMVIGETVLKFSTGAYPPETMERFPK